MQYESVVEHASKTADGVMYVVARMSFERRMDLARRVREIAQKAEFLAAGSGTGDQMEAVLLSSEIDRTYLLWGLRDVRGLTLDGEVATPESLVSKGPEPLFREALALVKAEAGLSEDERKN